MLRHASTKARQALHPDFLALSLIRCPSRFSSTEHSHKAQAKPSPREGKKPPFPLQTSSPFSLFAKLRTNVDDEKYNSPGLTTDKVESFNQTIAEIRRTLNSSRKPDELLRLWKQLDQLKIVHMLGHARLVPLSTLMVETFLKSPTGSSIGRNEKQGNRKKGKGGHEGSGTIVLDSSLKQLVKNIALLAARSDSWDAINALMRYHIREKDRKAILSLYDKFLSLVGDENLKMDQEFQVVNEEEGGEVEKQSQLATDTELKSHRSPPAPVGRVHLLMAVVTAHAMRGSFKAALDTCMASVVQLDERHGTAFIEHALGHDPPLHKQVRKYLPLLIVARLVSDPAVFVHRVTRLGTTRSAVSLERLYGDIRSALEGPDAILAADPSLITEKKTLALTTTGWNALLSASLKCEKRDLAGRLWDDMTKFGAPPGVSMWTALLDAYGQIGAVDDASATWDMMVQQGVQPDTLAYRAIISALFKGRRPDGAMDMFEKFKALAAEEGHHRLSLYNTVLHGLCASDREEEATKIQEEMEKEGPKPDLVTYNTFVNYYGRRQKFQSVATTLRAMQAAGLTGDAFTYTAILTALLKAGKKDAADLVLALMDKQGVKKNVALYSSLIDHQLREGGEPNFQAALRMLAAMEKDPHNQPNEVTYTSVLCGLYRLGWMDPDELQRIEADLIKRIHQRGVSLGLPAYHLLLKACLVYPHENGVQQALAYYEEMKRREIPIINNTWYILLAGLLHRDEWAIADKIVEEMYASGIHPKGSLLRLVRSISSRSS